MKQICELATRKIIQERKISLVGFLTNRMHKLRSDWSTQIARLVVSFTTEFVILILIHTLKVLQIIVLNGMLTNYKFTL